MYETLASNFDLTTEKSPESPMSDNVGRSPPDLITFQTFFRLLSRHDSDSIHPDCPTYVVKTAIRPYVDFGQTSTTMKLLIDIFQPTFELKLKT